MQPASAMPAEAAGSPGTLSGNVVHMSSAQQADPNDDTLVSVTTLTQTQYTSAVMGEHVCASYPDTAPTMKFCQVISSDSPLDVYADLGQTTDLGAAQTDDFMSVLAEDRWEKVPVPSTTGAGPLRQAPVEVDAHRLHQRRRNRHPGHRWRTGVPVGLRSHPDPDPRVGRDLHPAADERAQG
jgi:hypothetical protein